MSKRHPTGQERKLRLLSVTSVLACLLGWHLASRYHLNLGVITFAQVPTPVDVAKALWGLLSSSDIFSHLSNSLRRVSLGFGIAALIGVVLGVLVGRSPKVAATLLPPLEILRPIPAVAWIPLAILMFPSSEWSMVFITFTGALFPILLNAVHGVEAIDQRLIASARSLGASRWNILREVVVPGAAPSIVTGLTIGMGTSWFCLVTAEMVAGQWGIGYYTWQSFLVQHYNDVVVGMLLIGLLGMSSSALVKWAGNRLIPWYHLRRSY